MPFGIGGTARRPFPTDSLERLRMIVGAIQESPVLLPRLPCQNRGTGQNKHVIARPQAVAIRFPSVPQGDGRYFAPLRIRIATSGFALLAMTW